MCDVGHTASCQQVKVQDGVMCYMRPEPGDWELTNKSHTRSTHHNQGIVYQGHNAPSDPGTYSRLPKVHGQSHDYVINVHSWDHVLFCQQS